MKTKSEGSDGVMGEQAKKWITITVPYVDGNGRVIPQDPAQVWGGIGYTTRDGRPIWINASDVAQAISAWPSEPTTDYAKRLAEIEATHAAVADDDAQAGSVAHADRGWLLGQHRAASDALTAAGIHDDGRLLAERVHDLVAALRAAKVLGENGALGPVAKDILDTAALLKRIALGSTVEHRCADPATCRLCNVPTPEESAAIVARLGEASEAMTDATLEAIRKRHECIDDGSLAHLDRGDLLREVYRLRSDYATLRRVTDRGDERCAEVTRLLHEARAEVDRLRALVPHESPLEPWPEPTDEEIAAGHKMLRGMGSKEASIARLRAMGLDVADGHVSSLARLMTDPAARARFNGSRARIVVLDAPTQPERRGAAGMREWLNNHPDLALADKPISVADLARALCISEDDMCAIEAGTKTTDDEGWTEIQTALFGLGGGMKPEHIADPTSDPAFAKALDAAEGPQTEEDREAVARVIAASCVDEEEAWARVLEERAANATKKGASQ